MEKNEMTIGRDLSCDIQLNDPDISRKHCLFTQEKGRLVLVDISRNGTFVNGRRITQLHLKSLDQIQVGAWNIRTVLDFPISPEETVIQEKRSPAKTALDGMLGTSEAMQKSFELIQKVAPSDATVCFIGESGTGKELAARSIHNLSNRRNAPFVALNCGAMPENLVESLLFGHEKGSFTGAAEKHIGVFEEAHTGTLFLDEIGEMPIDLQTRLLRVLETKTVRKVGGKTDQPIDVRLVAATHRDLRQQIAAGFFRQDLFYRLYVFPIALAPLRERTDDIETLAKHFSKTLSLDDQTKQFSPGAMETLKQHPWPGNVRELKNVIQRALLLNTSSTIDTDAIELNIDSEIAPQSAENLADKEKGSIISILKKTNGNKSEAARYLGIARTTLSSKLRKHKIV